jgi:hypothetical protein
MKKNYLAKFLPACVALALWLSPITMNARQTPTCNSPKGSYFGGPILSQVEIVPVFWNSLVNSQLTAPTTGIAQFYADVTQSTFWTWLREYSTPTQTILPGTAYEGITIVPLDCPSSATGTCKITDADVEAELVRQVGLGVLPAPTSNTLYMIHFPHNISLSGPDGAGNSCANGGFCAYHFCFMSGSNVYVYGCMMDQFTGGCATGCGGNPTDMENATDTASHELVEAVTDPYVGLDTEDGYAFPCGWADNNNDCGELADICDSAGAGYTITVSGRSWVVQGIWSDCQGKCTATGPADAGDSLTNQSAITYKNSAVAITLNSYPGCLAYGSHVYTVTTSPAHGSLSGTAPNYTYTPTNGYTGQDSFQYLDTGIGVTTNGNNVPATVSIAVLPLKFSITTSTLDATGTNLIVCWQSVPGGVYTVLTNARLTAPTSSWVAAGSPITATATNTCFTLPGGIVGKTNEFVVIKQ